MAAQASAAAGLKLDLSAAEQAGGTGQPAPVTLSAERLRSVLDQVSVAEGAVDLRQAGLRLTADSLELVQSTQIATARGQVVVQQDGTRIEGSLAVMRMDTREGHVESPKFRLERSGISASGWARRVDFVGSDRLSAQDAHYTSCPADGSGGPDWLLSTDRLTLDFEHNEGRAEGAVLRFLGVPILGLPVLSFPATDARKSGWLPPTIYPFDSRNGAEVELPWYWNLAPNYDLTLTPGVLTRRGASLKTDLRYLFAGDEGELQSHLLPGDRLAKRSRYSLQLEHLGQVDGGLRYSASLQAASDDAYWKDFSQVLPSLTPRLLAQDLRVSRLWTMGRSELESYGRLQGWQVLQGSDLIAPPYQRLPQLGLRLGSPLVGASGLDWRLEGEFNRFVLRNQDSATDSRHNADRLHLLGHVARPFDLGWGWLTPRLAVNAAAYDFAQPLTDGRQRLSRTIPTFSLDGGLRYERQATLLGREMQQTLEPRLHYVHTPWRNQDAIPNFDAAVYDFNEISIYGDNAFSGVDYVTDVHQITLGATTRWFDRVDGTEWLRLGAAQRYLLRDQRITADRLGTTGLSAESTAAPATRFSDLLLFGSTTLVPHWRLDGTVQYSTDQSRFTRSILSARWQPQPFHTLAATYRYARDLSEQVELGWQWPIYRREQRAEGSSCTGTLYGVGRVNYSMRDSRVTDAFAGVEYDAGCWISRVVIQRQSTSSSDATTRLMWQLELVGLSRLGPSPLQTLKDNIPGYQPLRSDAAAATTSYTP